MADFKHFIRPTAEKPPSLVSVTIVSALVGLATGAAGFSLLRAFYPSETIITDSTGDLSSLKVTFDEPLTVVAAQLDDHIVPVYSHLETSNTVLYTDREYVATALIVTSDGWLMIPSAVTVPAQLDVIVNNKVYRVTEQHLDTVAQVRFLKIDANNVSPIRFAKDDEIKQGALLVYEQARIAGGSLFNRSLVRQIDAIDMTSRLSQIHGVSLVDQAITIEQTASEPIFYFSAGGAVAGVGQNGQLVPAYYIRTAVDKLLAKTSYVSLGVSYLDLYRLPGHQEDEGVLITPGTRAAITPGSPAAKAGLKSGDRIVAVAGTTIGYNNNNSLGKLLLGYKSGDSVMLDIVRDGKKQQVTVQF